MDLRSAFKPTRTIILACITSLLLSGIMAYFFMPYCNGHIITTNGDIPLCQSRIGFPLTTDRFSSSLNNAGTIIVDVMVWYLVAVGIVLLASLIKQKYQ